MSSTNKLLNAWISTNTGVTGGVSLRNEGKTILVNDTTTSGSLITTGGINATATQTVDFGANVPQSTGTATLGKDLINKTYADANYHPVGSYMDLSTNQTAGGVKTFTSTPVFQSGCSVNDGYRVTLNNSKNNLYLNNSNPSNWNTTATNNCVVGMLSGANLNGSNARYNTVVGTDALSSAVSTDQCTAVGYQALKFQSTSSVGNSAIGCYSATSLTTNSSSNGFFGTAVGNGIISNSSNNFAMATDSMSNTFAKPTLLIYYSGANVTANTYTLQYSGTVDKWATYLFAFVGSGAQFNTAYRVTCSEVNYATNTLTFETNTWRLTTDTYLVLYERGAKISTNYTGGGGTGTTFTIQTGLAITAGMRMSYMESSTINKQATVSTYNSTTGSLVLTTSITIYSSNHIIDFYNSTRVNGDSIANNLSMGRGALQNVSSLTTNCVALGAFALNGVGGTYDNTRFFNGTGCVAIGYKAGASCWGKHEYNTFIGAQCDVENPRLNNITNSLGIGYNVKLWKSNQIVIGGTTADKSLYIAGLMEFDNDGDQILIMYAPTDFLEIPTCSASYSGVGPLSLITKAYADATYHPSGSYMDLSTNQTAGGVKTFSSIPLCSASYTSPGSTSLITKAYADATYHPSGSYMDLSTNQTAGGIKTFTSTPVFASNEIDLGNSVKLKSTSVGGNTFSVYCDGIQSFYANQYGLGANFYGNGANITALNATEIASGTIGDTFLSPNVVLENTANTFTQLNTFQNGITASTTQTINFGSNAPTMSGANISTGSIPISSIIKNSATLNNARVTFFAPNSAANITNPDYPGGTYDITLVGALAGNNLDDSGDSFQAITCIGSNAYGSAPEGQEIVAIGANAGGGCNISNFCVFIGSFCGGTASHYASTFVGQDSAGNMTGNRFYNNCIGSGSYSQTTTGDSNTGQGTSSGQANTTGSQNTCVGAFSYGTDVGYESQNSNNCVYIGARSGNGNTASITNSVAIGYNCQVTSSNTIQLGNSSQNVNIPGKLTIVNPTTGTDVVIINKYGTSSYLYMNNGNGQIGFWDNTALKHKWFLNGTGNMMLHNQYVGQSTYQNITGAWSTLDANGYFYSVYSVNISTSAQVVTLPTPSAENVGCMIQFCRVAGTTTNTILVGAGVLMTGSGYSTNTTLMASNIYTQRIVCVHQTATTYIWAQR